MSAKRGPKNLMSECHLFQLTLSQKEKERFTRKRTACGSRLRESNSHMFGNKWALRHCAAILFLKEIHTLMSFTTFKPFITPPLGLQAIFCPISSLKFDGFHFYQMSSLPLSVSLAHTQPHIQYMYRTESICQDRPVLSTPFNTVLKYGCKTSQDYCCN